MRANTLTVYITVSALLCGCEEWPPHEQEIINYFVANEESVILLKGMLIDSKYLSVSNMGAVYGRFDDGESRKEIAIMNDNPVAAAKWMELFESSGIDHIGRKSYGDTTVTLFENFYNGILKEDINWEARFVLDSDLSNQIRMCGNKNPNVRCGSCISEIGSDWWLVYRWAPFTVLPEAREAYRNDEISQDEYYESSFEALNACFAEGGMFLENEGWLR